MTCEANCTGVSLNACIEADNFVNGTLTAGHFKITQGTLTATNSVVQVAKDDVVIATDTFDLTTNKKKIYDNGGLCVELMSIDVPNNSANYVVKYTSDTAKGISNALTIVVVGLGLGILYLATRKR